MRRSYSVDENYELVFNAPLTTNLQDTVSGVVGVTNLTSGGTIDSERGLYGYTNGANKYFLKFDMRNTAFRTKAYQKQAFLLQYTIAAHPNNSSQPIRPVLWQVSDNATPNNAILWNNCGRTGQGLVFDTEQTFYQLSEHDWVNMKSTTVRWNNLNDKEEHAVWTNNSGGWRMDNFNNVNYVFICPSIQNGYSACTGYIKDIKFYVSRQ